MNLIKCPYCGEEYLPEEIFISEDFKNIVKNITKEDGKIVFYLGDSWADNPIKETYECDSCAHSFKVYADLVFKTEKDEFEEDTVIKVC